MRWLSLAAVLLACGAASGQEPSPVRPTQARLAPIVRSIPLNASGIYPSNVVASPTLEVDFSQAPPGAGATFAANTGQTLTQQGTITRRADGTYPAGTGAAQGNEWNFNGSTDYITSTIGPPAGDFSVACVVTPSAATADATIAGNYIAGTSKRGWRLAQATNSATFSVSDDGSAGGGHITTITVASALAANRTSVVIASYDYITDGTSVGKLYVDALTAGSSTAMDGPVYSGAGNAAIGADGGGATYYAGTISHCTYWNGYALSATEAVAIRNTWLGVLSTSRVPVSTTAATPPALQVASGASGTMPFLRTFGANMNTISNNGTCSGLFGPSAITNKVWRGSLATWAGGVPTGWTESVTSTGDCAQTTASMAHGLSAARCTLADNDDAVSLTSGCATVTGGTLYQLSAWAKSISGTPLLTVTVIEDDSADCGSPTTTTNVINGVVPTTDWGIQRGAITTQAATIRAQVRVTVPAAAAQVLDIDAVQLRAAPTNGTVTDAFCSTDADSDAVCNTIVNGTPSPYSANGPMTTTLTACSPWEGTSLGSLAYILVDAIGANAIQIYVDITSDEPLFVIYDSAAAYKYIIPNVLNWASLTPYTLKFGHDGNGNLRIWWNGAWRTLLSGAGTGKRSAAQTTTNLCGSTSVGHDMYVRDIVVYRRVIP